MGTMDYMFMIILYYYVLDVLSKEVDMSMLCWMFLKLPLGGTTVTFNSNTQWL